MTQIYVTYHEVVCHNVTICYDKKGMVLSFGSFEVYKSKNLIRELAYASY